MKIDFPKLLDELKRSGLTDEQICQSIGRSESNYIWRLSSGAIANPSFDTGHKLMRLFESHCSGDLPVFPKKPKRPKKRKNRAA